MQHTDSDQGTTDQTATVKVWDRFLRFFHWTLVACFATAFISGETNASTLHVLVGYLLCVLLAARVYWGFKGSEYARFRAFIFPAGEAVAYLRSMLKGNPKHYYGHNPAGALMVFTMFGLLVAIFATGLLSLGTIDFEGPLSFLANRVSDEASYVFRNLHHILPPVALGLVVLHLLGVLVGSIQHKENLVRAMLTGKKSLPSQTDSNHKKTREKKG